MTISKGRGARWTVDIFGGGRPPRTIGCLTYAHACAVACEYGAFGNDGRIERVRALFGGAS